MLDGAHTQSADDIKLFLDRVLAFPDQTFTIVYVDELPANEQEIIANFLAKHSRSAENMHLHCVQFKDTILHAPPGVEVKLWEDSLLNDAEHSVWLQNVVTEQGHVNSLTVVCGPSGSGKTRHIRRELGKLKTNNDAEVASIYIHEDFCLAKAVASLRTKFNCGASRNRAIHFGFSMAASEDIMLSVNAFFNSFLILRCIYDPSSGSCFHSGMHSFDIFVELDGATNEEAGRAWLAENAPVLSCCNDIIQPPLDYNIDHQTRRVCTYLRAYDDGTINRKFNPTQKSIMFVLDKSGSMLADLGGSTALQTAADSMLGIFDSHLQLMDVSALSVLLS